MEEYKPTEKDIKKGEAMMTASQEELSGERERTAIRLKALGVDGYLDEVANKEGGGTITGKINGHEVSITYLGKGEDIETYVGKLDSSTDMTTEDIKKFMEKYGNTVSSYSRSAWTKARDPEQYPAPNNKDLVMRLMGL